MEADMRRGLYPTCTSSPPGRRAQRGVAAIEFALTVVLLLVIAFAIVSYGAMFWAQQKLSHLAGEGARYALVLSMNGTGGGAAQLPCSYIDTLAKNDALLHKAPGCSIPCTPSECPWNAGASTEPTSPAEQYATITLNYSVQDLPLAGIVGQLAGFFSSDSSNWVPTTLTASSTVRLASG